MKLDNKRLFINNLPDDASQTDIENKFSNFGSVLEIQIKQRKNIGPNQTSQFAYVQLNISKHDLQECLQEFANKKWNGHWVNVQEAKESFMERLKRERNEQAQDQNGINIKSNHSELPTVRELNQKINAKEHYISNSKSSYNEQQEPAVWECNESNDRIASTNSEQSQNNVDNLVIKKGTKRGLIIESVGKEPIAIIEEKKKPVKNKNLTKADEKRIQSVLHMRKEYRQQKLLIKNALSNIDSKSQNKIIFDDEVLNSTTISEKRSKYDEDTNLNDIENNLKLFEDEEDDGEEKYNFEVKEHFEGKKGQQLMELQSKFKNDKRFTMDSRFLDDESDEESALKISPHDDSNQEITLEEEKRRQFDILGEVLGTNLVCKPADRKNEKTNFKMMLRFDPSQATHSKYEVHEPVKEKTKKKRGATEVQIEKTLLEDASKPEVSKDTFYKVTVDLKDTLQEKEGFSLTSLFNSNIQNDADQGVKEEETPQPKLIKKQKTSLVHEPNPFKYDSSSDESDEEEDKQTKKETEVETNKETSLQTSTTLGTTKLWTEPFFFKDDDYRLQEGLDFIKRLEVDNQENFGKVRRNLHEIVKAKVRNTQRKNRPFRKKLGGKKRIRIKKAMKR